MGTPITSGLVTAIPILPGYPTVSGGPNSNGKVELPLSPSTNYNLEFTDSISGYVPNFSPSNASFTFYKLKNKGSKTSFSIHYPTTFTKLAPGRSGYVLPGSYSITLTFLYSNFKSWKPGSRFTNPTARSTTFVMPAADTSISAFSQAHVVSTLFVTNGSSHALSSVGLSALTSYKSSKNSWKSKAKAPTRRFRLAGGVAGGNFYVVCGEHSLPLKTNQQYDPTTDLWATKASALTATWGLVAGALKSELYAVDGSAGPNNQLYKVSKNSWVAKRSDLTSRESLAAGVIGSQVYATDGLHIKTVTRVANNNVYNTASNAWTAKASDTTGRSGVVAAVAKSKYYVFDGFSATSGSLDLNHVYIPSGNSWITKQPDPTIRRRGGAATLGSTVFVFDGSSKTAGALAINNAYDPASDTWSTKARDLIKRDWVAVGVTT